MKFYVLVALVFLSVSSLADFNGNAQLSFYEYESDDYPHGTYITLSGLPAIEMAAKLSSDTYDKDKKCKVGKNFNCCKSKDEGISTTTWRCDMMISHQGDAKGEGTLQPDPRRKRAN